MTPVLLTTRINVMLHNILYKHLPIEANRLISNQILYGLSIKIINQLDLPINSRLDNQLRNTRNNNL